MSWIDRSPSGQLWLVSTQDDGTLLVSPTTADETSFGVGWGAETGDVMTRPELIEQVKDLTAHKADDRLNFDKVYLFRHQQFVQRKRYWWRQRILEFPISAAKQVYSLLDPVDMGGGNVHRDVQKFETVALYDSNDGFLHDLEPITDFKAKRDLTKKADTGTPGRYFWEMGSLSRVRLDLVPDGAYKFVATYWTVSGTSAVDYNGDVVQIIPPWLYHCLINGMVMDVKMFLYGAKDSEYLAAKAAYDESCEAADLDREFAPSVTEFRTGETAVRSSTSRR
jgi:hypothetical protein